MNLDSKYKPVNCNFHDQLLHFATFKEVVDVVALVEGHEVRFSSTVKDVFTENSEEYILFANEQRFRLDMLVEVGGYFSNGSCKV
jgi:transcriptional antiterminator Rof (Rho-off)